MSIAAIETSYKGYRFRSRLEARWAVFFDAMEIKWVYEPEGFKKDDDLHGTINYLPDFYLPEINVWVEVKSLFSTDNARKLARFLDWYSPLPGFTDSWKGRNDKEYKGGLVLLGNIPEPNDNFVLHKIVRHYKGLVGSRFVFYSNNDLHLWVGTESEHFCAFGASDEDLAYLFDLQELEKFNPWTFKLNSPTRLVSQAYQAARSARFEYGESGSN